MNVSRKNGFPIFSHRPGLVYLDSAATTLKPQSVIDAVTGYYERCSANVGRGLYPIAEEATSRVEQTRERVASFIGADPDEIVFTHGTTESVNLLASVLTARVKPGDNIVVTAMEHHSDYLPWERLARERGAELRVIPFGVDGTIDISILGEHIDTRTKVFAFAAVSNVLGTINPVVDFVTEAKRFSPDVLTVVDAAQAAGHIPIDVRGWDCDFLAFSGHKMFGPTGVGVFYGKKSLLDTLPPYQVGGGTVLDACASEPEYRPAPHRFEAGTPDIAAIIGFEAALDFVGSLGVANIREHETALVRLAMGKLKTAFGDAVTIYGPTDPDNRGGLISFTFDGLHPHDLAQLLGENGICIRAGEHCTGPLHRVLGLPATARASFSVYNDTEDIERLIEGMRAAHGVFQDHSPHEFRR